MKNTALTLGSLSLVAALALAGCGSDDAQEAESASTSASSAVEHTGSHVKVAHALGEVEVPVNPQNVVAGGAAIDTLLSLGVTPAAVIVPPEYTELPWREGKLDGVTRIETIPKNGSEDDQRYVPDSEQIAALSPDLIVGDQWMIDEAAYAGLSEIAPTIGGIDADDNTQEWREQLKVFGEIFDKEDEAQKVLDEDSERFKKAREDMPNIANASALVADCQPGVCGVLADPEDPSAGFFTDLGMGIPPLPDDLEKSGATTIVPDVRVDALNSDFLAVVNEGEGMGNLQAFTGFDYLQSVQNDSLYPASYAFITAIATPSAPSREWALTEVTPTLKKVKKFGA
ncbi:Putative ABC transporter substrate-binding lipoprotein YhfQ precursor [Corynebacterium ciconiae DSM 44920]|uniref:ABC transporter substrate-binding protein n=1 Tax=Corynebacterium ciconiae TaxID=227319 RepID=UPI0003A68628|nr:ABC transporter substrate-binding protein [Corynebacterium ciconiae]WKD60351.1 Putative ABC transporter substrate-binding lipoprotein YhfQ precursor [Corynebacterium ciconiae DSM 44920]